MAKGLVVVNVKHFGDHLKKWMKKRNIWGDIQKKKKKKSEKAHEACQSAYTEWRPHFA